MYQFDKGALIIGYDKQIEDRAYMSGVFPTIDIADGTSARVNYISTGFDPFTPGNKLDYNTFHITNNLTKYANKHTLTAGVNFEMYQSNNLFYPASNGVYIFNSLTDFYIFRRNVCGSYCSICSNCHFLSLFQ